MEVIMTQVFNAQDVKDDSAFFKLLVSFLRDEGLLEGESGSLYEQVFSCIYDLTRESVSYGRFLTLIEVIDAEGIDSLFLDDPEDPDNYWVDPRMP
jgi:hypothetical protein